MKRAVHLALGICGAEQPRRLEQLTQRPFALAGLEPGERELPHLGRHGWRGGRRLRRPGWWRWWLRHAVGPALADIGPCGLLPLLALRQLEPMHLAEHRHAGELGALEFGSDLRCR